MTSRLERATVIADRVKARYTRNPAEAHAWAHDASYHLRVRTILQWLQLMDRALAAEGMDETVRDRVVFRMLYEEAPGDGAELDWAAANDRAATRHADMLRRLSALSARLLPAVLAPEHEQTIAALTAATEPPDRQVD